eukprot:2477757-Karenia_brevis.AAC.1
MTDLLRIRHEQTVLLDAHQQAADLFNKNGDNLDLDDAMALYWSLLDPTGIRERQDHNDSIESEIREMEVNMLGYYFTFQRDRFWQYARIASEELKRELVSFSICHAAQPSPHMFSPDEFENSYFSHEAIAYSWQESFSDEDDNDDLMQLLR